MKRMQEIRTSFNLTVQTLTGTTLRTNLLGQSAAKLDITPLWTNRRVGHNMGLNEMAGEVVKTNCVLLSNICA
jgi:hypothetical protein